MKGIGAMSKSGPMGIGKMHVEEYGIGKMHSGEKKPKYSSEAFSKMMQDKK